MLFGEDVRFDKIPGHERTEKVEIDFNTPPEFESESEDFESGEDTGAKGVELLSGALGGDDNAAAFLELVQDGAKQKDLALEFGFSRQKVSKLLAQLREDQGLLVEYRNVRGLHLTRLQAQILSAITPEKLADASLSELTRAYKVFQDKELTLEGKPSEITGIVGYLLEIDKKEKEVVLDVEPTEVK